MESKTTKPYRHCPGEEYEISIFICRGRQKVHYPKCPECEFRTTTEEISPIPVEKETITPTSLSQTKTGSIMVKSEPPSAVIFLDDDNIGVTPAIITQILPGKYKIKIKMEGYNSWSQSVDVKANKETSLTAVLQGKDCSVVIESKPTKAEIFIDGNKVGVTPVIIDNVKTGKHLVEVKLDGYEVWSKEINVETEQKTSLTAELTTNYGAISLSSEPTKAKIFLDGIEVGTTPAILRSVPHGTHLIEVMIDGYGVWGKSVTVEPGKENVLTAILQVKTGSASIKSQPKNAKIYLDGKYAGTTPESIPSINPGTHEIKIEIDNYDVWTETVNIEAGKENITTAVLQRSTGTLMVESEPANAVIFIDGKEIGHTPEIIMSSAKGTHAIEVRMDGYDIWKDNVDIEPGTEKSITATLQLKTGSLNINSKPSGGAIFLDGKETGTTPESLKGVELGTHQVEVKMDGYENWSESVEVSVDKENQITAVLQQLAGSLNIKSEPANAMIIVDGKEAGTTPANIANLKPGKHLVEVRMEGYENWSESIEVSVDKENQIIAVLQQLAGSLNIKSEPVTAMITVDGKEVGTSPANIADLKSGKHLVEVKLAGYENWSESVEIDMGKEADLTAVLQLKAGSFTINSVPSDAMISIDGKAIDTTPLTITDPGSGKHSVEVRMDGYETWSESVNIVPGEPISLTATLQIKAGTVSITSEPSDAFAFIDGKEVGRTPVIITDQSPGTHKFELKMDKYETWSKSVDIKPGKEVVLTAVLQSKAGSVNINSNPSNATAFVEGKEIGTTPVIISNSSPGTYLVEVRMDGYETWNESVNIEQGKQITITADLQMKAGAININSNPSGATIHIDGKNVGKTPKTITDLLPGMHLVEVKLDGHETWSESAEVKGDKENTLTAKLQKLTGSINIKSNPPEAAIYLDSEKIGTTPDTLKSVAIGAHEVEISMEGYAEWKKSLNIKKGKEITLNAVLQSNTGTASIDSDPAEAMVLLDGKDVGKTPVSLTGIKIGIYEIELQKEGYVSCKKTIKIKAGRVNSLTAKLTEMTAAVNITSEPSNAIVCIDGKETGNSPVIITDLTAGKHLVEIRMNGYEMWSDNVNIDPGKEITVTAELQIKPGSVSINSEPPNAM
ncbi:MAG: PEGA domain-containing protein, partial [Candidatus Brocadiales bacterium]|nr:PEGA domain-containing protein [Candidatus Brocadiales bacterium]